MAYKNVWLPWEEGRTFDLPVWGKETYHSFTIDEEKDAVLLRGTPDKDNPSEKPFYFYFKGEIVSMIMFISKVTDGNTVTWSMKSIDIPDSLDGDEVFEELRKAFKAYGWQGKTEEECERWKKRTGKDGNPNGIAIIDF